MNNDIDNITLCGTQIALSEDESDPSIYRARFCISGFGVNKNGVQIDREHIEEWISTLVDKPVVGKVSVSSNGEMDFESHNFHMVSKVENGKIIREAEFDTTPFGHFTSASIEKADDGNEYIYADAILYKRYKNAIGVLERRMSNGETVSTSWEISVLDNKVETQKGKIVKIITNGRFLAHCFLGAKVEPAFDESGLLSVASKDEDELNTALSQDYISISESSDINENTDKEVNMELDNKIVETSENVDNTETVENENQEISETVDTQTDTVEKSENATDDNSENTETSKCGGGDNDKKKEKSEYDDNKKKECSETDETQTDDTETSALTDRDIRQKLYNIIKGCIDIIWIFPADGIAWVRDYDKRATELDFVEYKFHIENDEVVLDGEPIEIKLTGTPKAMAEQIAQKDSAITEMSTQIKSLSDEVSALKPYKDKVDEIEKAEKEAELEKNKKELSDYAISSGHITQEEIESSEEIKTMISELDKAGIKSIIADRVVASLASNKSEDVETSEDNSQEHNVQINLSAIDSKSNDTSKINTDDARQAIRSYINRK